MILSLLLLLGGVFTGISSGLLGIGGGTILVPLQYWALSQYSITGDIAMRIALGTSLLIIFPTVIAGTIKHSRMGAVVWKVSLVLGITGALGSAIGGMAAAHLPDLILKRIFSAIVFFAAFGMLFQIPSKETRSFTFKPSVFLGLILCGLCAGVISGLVGIGGGLIIVPLLVMTFHFDIHKAIGTSTATIPFMISGGIIAYLIEGIKIKESLPPYSFGYLNLALFALLVITTIPGAYWGAHFTHKLPKNVLRKGFSILLFLIGLKMSNLI